MLDIVNHYYNFNIDLPKGCYPKKSEFQSGITMNLMFRKNFREQKTGIIIKGSKGSAVRHGNKRSSREQGYSPIEEHHYRTHLFFSPPRCSYSADDSNELRCGPIIGACGEPIPSQSAAISPAMTESDLPQPVLVEARSVPTMKWSTSPNKNTSTRQVSFNYGPDGNLLPGLPNLERDCFIIPLHSLNRFLPAGVSIPKPVDGWNIGDAKCKENLQVLEVSDPKLCVLCHLMSPLEPIDPVLESPLIQPLFKQRILAVELLNEVMQAKTAQTGMLLANMERNAEFPFISYYVINSVHTNPVLFYNNLRTASLTKFDPRSNRYTAAHTLDLYTEVVSICRPPVNKAGTSLTKMHSSSTGYLISVYKVFEGDDKEKFEKNWLYWTGARLIYRYLPSEAGLRKISLYKSLSPKGDKMYVLICECSHLLNDVNVCALILPALRARLTGYTGLYRPIEIF